MYCQGWTSQKIWLLSQIWPCRSRSIASQNNRDLNQCTLRLWSKFGDPSLNRWRVIARTRSKWVKFWFWSYIWPWRSRSITLQSNRDLSHLRSKFGDPNLNGWWVIARTSKWLPHTQTDGRTDTQTDRRRQRQYPKVKTGLGQKYIPSIKYRFQSICPWEMQLLFQLCIF